VRRRELATLAALTDAVVAPEPPLPPVAATDALPAFARWLARAPRVNRAGVRAALTALELAPLAVARPPFSAQDRAGRLRTLHALHRAAATRAAAEALRAAAAVSYYGDAGVLRALGHDPAERVREARERRAAAAAAGATAAPGARAA
jgi:hypothetical protein